MAGSRCRDCRPGSADAATSASHSDRRAVAQRRARPAPVAEPSMNSNTAKRASRRLRNVRRSSSSHSRVAIRMAMSAPPGPVPGVGANDRPATSPRPGGSIRRPRQAQKLRPGRHVGDVGHPIGRPGGADVPLSTKAGAGRVASPRVVALAERWRPARSLPACCISRATRLCPTRRPRPAIRRRCAGDHTPRGSNSRSPRCAPALSIPPRSRRLDTPLPEHRNRLQTVRPPSPARHQHPSPADEPQRPCRGPVNPRPVAKRSPSSLSTYPQ